MRILLIEDSLEKAALINKALSDAGHDVTHIVGVYKRRADRFTGLDKDKEPVEIRLDEFAVAIVDGMLEGRWHGWDIIPHLTLTTDIVCIAISSEDSFNRRMMDAGAVRGVLKSEAANKLPVILEEIAATLARGETVPARDPDPVPSANVPVRGGGALGALRRRWEKNRTGR